MNIEPYQPTQQPSVPLGKFDKTEVNKIKRTNNFPGLENIKYFQENPLKGYYKVEDTNKDGLPDLIYGYNKINGDRGYRYDRYLDYDEAGELTSIIHDFYDDNNVDAYYEYEYENGKLTKEKETYYDLKGEVSGANETEYGDDYKIERTLGKNGNGETVYTIRKYGSDGKLISVTTDKNNDGVVDKLEEYENGKLVKTSVDTDGNDEFDIFY